MKYSRLDVLSEDGSSLRVFFRTRDRSEFKSYPMHDDFSELLGDAIKYFGVIPGEIFYNKARVSEEAAGKIEMTFREKNKRVSMKPYFSLPRKSL
jgi:hypothetical protein